MIKNSTNVKISKIQPITLWTVEGIDTNEGLTVGYFCNVQPIIPPIACKITIINIETPSQVWSPPASFDVPNETKAINPLMHVRRVVKDMQK